MRLSLACLAASAARTVSRRAQRGIYAGKDVRSGNKVSEDGGNR
jgi:cob(I)alamin adenosyltransferase